MSALTVAPRLLRTHAVNRTSMSDHHGPTTHPASSRVEPGCLAPELDERLLCDLLGLGGIADDPQHDAVERGRQHVVELGERPLIAPRDPSHQRTRVSAHVAHTTFHMWALFGAGATGGSVFADFVRHKTGQSTARAGRALTMSRASCSSPKTS